VFSALARMPSPDGGFDAVGADADSGAGAGPSEGRVCSGTRRQRPLPPRAEPAWRAEQLEGPRIRPASLAGGNPLDGVGVQNGVADFAFCAASRILPSARRRGFCLPRGVADFAFRAASRILPAGSFADFAF